MHYAPDCGYWTRSQAQQPHDFHKESHKFGASNINKTESHQVDKLKLEFSEKSYQIFKETLFLRFVHGFDDWMKCFIKFEIRSIEAKAISICKEKQKEEEIFFSSKSRLPI